VRLWSAILLAIAAAAIAPQTTMAVGAGAVGVLLESLPYLAAAALCSRLIGRYAGALVAYAGCGCAAGPSARSIPAAIATAAIFGLPVAVARVAVASVISRFVRTHDHGARDDVLGEIVSLIPAALLSAAIMLMLPSLPRHNLPAPVLFVGGALLGVVASPCALGGVALAASLHATAPFAGAGVLCTAGIVPHAWRRHSHGALHDPWAYGALALACALVAVHHGEALVHPRMTIPLALTAFMCLLLAWRFRACYAQTARLVAAAALAAIVIGAPVPAYRVTETTLADGFAGEGVDFTGVAVAEHGASALVRYAITCCRADAAPVALALDRNLARFDGRWMHASGVLESHDGALRLRVERLAPIAPPSDPFVYH
jgi:hypothetical protein